MRTCGWLWFGAGTLIPKEPGLGSIWPTKSSSFFCRFTQMTVLRLLTTDQIMGTDTKTMSEAWSLWDRIWADSRISFLPEPDDLEREFRSRSRLSSRSPKVWADAYLLAFAASAGLKLVTFDRALQSRSADVLVL
jgi:predicted nucleic acid-binding protein